jgi:HK97 gp10 family phage protein
MRVKFKLEGAKALERQLKALPDKVERQILRQAVTAAAKPVLEEAKAQAPVKSGALRTSLKVRAGKRRKGSVGRQVVTKDGFFKGEQFYGAFIELGTKFIEAREFMLNAFRRNKNFAIALIRAHIKAGIAAVARRS